MSNKATFIGVACAALAIATAVNPIPKVNVAVEGTTVSGISAGAFFASQFHVAFSSKITGVAMLAGGPYYCAQGQLSFAEIECMNGLMPISVSGLVDYADVVASFGSIDNPRNISNARVWLFSAYGDTVVKTSVVQAAQQFYQTFVPSSNITFVQGPGEHTQQTLSYGNDCSYLGSPYIGKCNYDAAGAQLNWIMPQKLTPPSEDLRSSIAQAATAIVEGQETFPAEGLRLGNGTLANFDQTVFVPGYSSSSGLDTNGYVFIPDECANPSAGSAPCPLHVSFHGCQQTQSSIGQQFVLFAGYLEWASVNNIVVLFPQATTSLSNPEGCFDWWGYTNGNYALQNGVQPAAVMGMIQALAGAQ